VSSLSSGVRVPCGSRDVELPRALKRRSKDPRQTLDRAPYRLARPRSVSGCRHPGPRRVFSSCRHQSRVRRNWIAFRRLPPLLEAPLSFEKIRRSAACTVAISTRTSHGVRCSPSAHAAKGARFTRRFHSPARSVPGDSHPFDGFLRPSPERACFIPLYAHGVRPVTAVSLQLLAVSRHRFANFPAALERRSRGTLLRPIHSRMRPPPFRAPELIPGSLSRAFSPSMAARTRRPDFLPRTSPRQARLPGLHAAGASECSPRKDRDALGLLRGARSLPS
jgi:hypothetical protein